MSTANDVEFETALRSAFLESPLEESSHQLVSGESRFDRQARIDREKIRSESLPRFHLSQILLQLSLRLTLLADAIQGRPWFRS